MNVLFVNITKSFNNLGIGNQNNFVPVSAELLVAFTELEQATHPIRHATCGFWKLGLAPNGNYSKCEAVVGCAYGNGNWQAVSIYKIWHDGNHRRKHLADQPYGPNRLYIPNRPFGEHPDGFTWNNVVGIAVPPIGLNPVRYGQLILDGGLVRAV